MADTPKTRQETRLTHAGRRADWTGLGPGKGGIVNPPVWRASTILYDDVAHLERGWTTNRDGDLFYGRRGTPTQWALAEAITEMEPGAAGTMLYPSGVAAIAGALLSVLKPGDHLLMVDSAYDPTRNFCEGFLKDWGVETSYYDPTLGADIASVMRPNTRAIFLESPGSLTFEVQDVPAIVAAAKAHGAKTILDNTWASPLYFTGIDKGVDLVMTAGTKYLGGHSDVMMGAVTANAKSWPALRHMAQLHGQFVSADDCYLMLRGLRTLSLRMAQHQASALQIANWLESQPDVARVLHPALPSHPGHALWQRDFTGASSLFSIILNGGDKAARAAMVDSLKLFGIGYSWGGYESLALPIDPEKYRSATQWQAEGPAIRLSIGLEHPDDLTADLAQGLAAFRAARDD
ncbi:MAG: cystathionine beta-lyase [Sphingomonadaceae bacterium]|nr:cystathionine beta-lyase [Sphingomonadaceae bacterium]NBU78805.1 cystathionine beta-lyase [Sphingomonadaceae bacterium]NCA00680.1 cystathionine beta-lyase [Sphingomonadaceae bacterium]